MGYYNTSIKLQDESSAPSPVIISTVALRNFRNFVSEEFRFISGFTIVIGNNGVGKSSILKGLQVALGAYLQSLKKLPPSTIYRRQFRPDERRVFYSEIERDYVSDDQSTMVEVHSTLRLNEREIGWSREYLKNGITSHGKAKQGDLLIFVERALQDRENAWKPLLVLANFGVSRLNAQVRKKDPSWRKKTWIEKGYYSALADTVDFTGVYNWLAEYDKNLKLGKEFEGSKEAFYVALKTAIPYIQAVEYNQNYRQLEMILDFEDGQTVESKLLEDLSDGTRSVVHMAAEIAYRCITINRYLKADAIKQSPGVVLIDEIDMLLHPKWQRHIVSDFKAAFPSIQFIATTHSPFIVQSLQSRELINLDRITEINPNTLPIEVIATEIMGVESESSQLVQHDLMAVDEFAKILTQNDLSFEGRIKAEVIEEIINSVTDPSTKAIMRLKVLEMESGAGRQAVIR